MTAIVSSKPLILGSASPWRRKVLEATGLKFTTMSADIDEKAIRHADPALLTWLIAMAKASALLPRVAEPSILVTCDQVVVYLGQVREKPVDHREASGWLEEYGRGGRTVSTVTTVVVTDTVSRRSIHATDVAEAWFGPVTRQAVEKAIARGDVLKSCGAFTLDDPDIGPLVVMVRGDGNETEVRSSISGLPRAKTLALIDRISMPPG